MEAIFPISALQRAQGEVKAAAKEDLVRITENGRGAYVFCSEDVYRDKIREAGEKAAYEARMSMVIERGRADIAAGRIYEADEAWGEIERRAHANG